jgi:protein TonB
MGTTASPKSAAAEAVTECAEADVSILDAEQPQDISLDETQSGALKHNRAMRWDEDFPSARSDNGQAVANAEIPLRAFSGQRNDQQEFTGQGNEAASASTMANDLQIQPETDSQHTVDPTEGHELDSFLGKAFEEKPIWAGLYESLRDVFFPPKLPPLVLTSTPIPVQDRMKVKANPWAIGISSTVNGAILALMIFLGVREIIKPKPPAVVTPLDVKLDPYKGPKAPQAAGGGGGSPDKMEAIKGKIPPRAPQVIDVPKIIQPPTPTIDVQKDIVIPDNPTLPNFGVSNSSNVKLASGGDGSGMGLGNGHGNGYGPGEGGNIGGGLMHVGGGVSSPVPIFEPEAEFSDEARRAKFQGVVVVYLIVDAQGNPQNVKVSQPLGMGLDEKAVEAVRKYKFKPAMFHGKAVPVPINIEVNFRLY